MKKKKIIASVLATGLSLTACTSEKNGQDEAIINNIVSQFEELTKVPRPSHHEEKISAYLENWAKEYGYDVTRDEYNNIIFDVPATEGRENQPMVAIQTHMDMVFVSKEGLNLDPLTTTITTKNDGKYLMSDGNTSLGSDDGIGVAIALCIAQNQMEHGPVRIIITTLNARANFLHDIDKIRYSMA